MTFFVVFDTCTHARYYGDVHQVLSLPEDAVIRYEYKRYLYTADAAAAIDSLMRDPSSLPVPALLMYGEKKGFVQGDAEPTTMLRVSDSVFVPTRSAQLVAVGVNSSANRKDDVLYLHFQLRGFVWPSAPVVDELVAALEAANSLPWGDRDTQHKWISLLPAALEGKKGQLISDQSTSWTQVVDKFIDLPTQFAKDVFWRVQRVVEFKGGSPGANVPIEDRGSNERAHIDRWHRDYPLYEGKRYAVQIQTYSPAGHGVDVPQGATIAMTSKDDDDGILRLASDPLDVVPNQTEFKRFSISTDGALDSRYTGVHLEAQVPDRTSNYPAGGMCDLTFSIRKQRWRLGAGLLFILAAAGMGAWVLAEKPNGWWSGGLTAGALLFTAVGGWLLTRQFKFGK